VHVLDVNRAGRVLLVQANERMGIKYFGPGESRERDLSWLGWSIATDISPDGRTLVMVEMGEASATSTVCLRKTDGSPVVRLGEGIAGSLSPDGKWVSSRRKLGSPIVLLPTGPGEPKEVSSQGLSTLATWVGWSPDGKSIFVLAREGERGPARLYLLSLDGGKPRAVSGEVADNSYSFPVSPDGRLVAAIGVDRKIALYPVAGGEARPVPGGAEGDIPLQWSTRGDSLFVRQDSGVPYSSARLYALEIGTGKRLLWKELFAEDPAGVNSIGRVRITPDGRSLAYGYRRLLSELYVAEGLK
jgi:dipeptidyl aminopeptidase/acylaminoacyl peptidase